MGDHAQAPPVIDCSGVELLIQWEAMHTVIDREHQEHVMRTIGANVRKLRVTRGLSQQQLADQLHVSRVQMNRIEQGRNAPQAPLLFAIADFFGVSVDMLGRISSRRS